MRLKANVFSLTAVVSLIFALPVFSLNELIYNYQEQNKIIQSVLDNEKDIKNQKAIIDILKHIDEVYGDLYNKLNNGGKITIFFDPAHGRLNNGRWQGEVTGRIGPTGLPEEYYSVQFSRKFYKLLSGNKFFKIISSDDYMQVLKGESAEYKKIFFTETLRLARSENVFLIISEHLNNISILQKTDGIINLRGIHVTCDEAGNRYLTNINSIYEGYLTLYNKYDSTGLSKTIANIIKNDLSSKGIKLNSWENGAVADDRFSYFTDFPISLIFEQGFISNPVEEEKLRDPEYQQKIVESQYNAILEGIKKVFGVDISGFWLKKAGDNAEIIDLIKLSRISIYYLQNDFPEKAVNTIGIIEKNYKSPYPDFIDPYINLKERIIKAEGYFKKCRNLANAKQYTSAKQYLLKAGKITGNEPIFTALTGRYSKYGRYFGIKDITFTKKESLPKIPTADAAVKASLNTPVILAIEKEQRLEDAIEKALSPGPEAALRINKAFNELYTREKVRIESYSEKTKKIVTQWKWEKKKVDFKEGLYIVTLNRNLKIINFRRVSQVLLDAYRYQNHQYLKNSYFASTTKEKSL